MVFALVVFIALGPRALLILLYYPFSFRCISFSVYFYSYFFAFLVFPIVAWPRGIFLPLLNLRSITNIVHVIIAILMTERILSVPFDNHLPQRELRVVLMFSLEL